MPQRKSCVKYCVKVLFLLFISFIIRPCMSYIVMRVNGCRLLNVTMLSAGFGQMAMSEVVGSGLSIPMVLSAR